MSIEMRKYIDNLKEFVEKGKKVEVIISYDCSEIHKPFGDNLLDLLKSEFYNSEEITMSNYRIGKLLTIAQIDILKDEILNLFKTSQKLTEAIRYKKSIVKIITPVETQFMIEEIINEEE